MIEEALRDPIFVKQTLSAAVLVIVCVLVDIWNRR